MTTLTDEELMGMYSEPRSDAEMIEYGREVEAAVLAKLAQQADRQRVPDEPTEAPAQAEVPWNVFKQTAVALAGLLEQVEKFVSAHGEADFETGEALRAMEAAIQFDDQMPSEAPAQGKPNDYDPLIEQSLAALIDLICPDLDSGDIVRDAQEAMRELNKRAAAPEAPAQGNAVDERAALASQPTSTFDVQQMLNECVPGGSSCDPQAVCDDIRAWFAKHGAQPTAQVEPVAWAVPNEDGDVTMVFLDPNEAATYCDGGKPIPLYAPPSNVTGD